IDKSPPDFMIISNGKDVSKEKIINIKTDSFLEIKGIDNSSGVKEILYSYDEKIFYIYEDGIYISDKKPFKLYFKLIDNVGNTTPLNIIEILPQ
ncbi:MAG: hypothetical protein OEV44_11715, partial [Spirochaetota bacterium]|nr:hypothetical protein [Spirochaetota bacterium]